MAKMTKSSLLKKLGEAGARAFDEHKDDETTMPTGGELPSGIEDGVARLVDCKFDTYKKGDLKGEYYFYAAGEVLSPESHDGVKIQGRRTQIGPEPLCDTPNRSRSTIDEHLAWIMNEFRKLGVDTAELSIEDLEPTAESLKEAQPVFSFRTWKGKATEQFRNPRVNHQWGGAVDTPFEGESSESDNADTDASDEEEEDLDALGSAADEGDEDAIARLMTICDEAGIDHEKIESWSEVVTMLSSEEAEPEPEEEESDDPQEGDLILYKPPGSRKTLECKVSAVFAKSRKVNLRDENGKVYKSVPYDKLEA